MTTHSEAFLRKRKFLMVLPLLVLPFLTLAFWNLGGGKGTPQEAIAQGGQKGLNLQLPEAQLKEKQHQDKLSHYDQAQQRARQRSAGGTSLFLQRLGFTDSKEENQFRIAKDTSAVATIAFAEPHEAKINQKLAQLEKAIQPTTALPEARQRKPPTPTRPPAPGNDRFREDVDRLEHMMQRMGSGNGNGTPDPEMQQLENMLDRILDIQHPERVKQRLVHLAPEKKQQTYALQASSQQATVTLLEPAFIKQVHTREEQAHGPETETAIVPMTGHAFYGLEDTYLQTASNGAGNVLEAAIHETKTLLAGATVKMRLLQDVYLAGRRVNKGSLLYGTCRVSGERLHIEVTSVLIQNAVLPVALAAYDLDGQEGLYIPGALTRDAAKQGADRAINQSLQLSALHPGIGAQAASAGIEAAKGLLSRQARQVKVTLNAGHRLLLCDQSIRR